MVPIYIATSIMLLFGELLHQAHLNFQFYMEGHYSNIEMKFKRYIFKKTVKNYNYYSVEDIFKISNNHLEYSRNAIVLCAFNILVAKYSNINVTLLSLNYNGPYEGYCKYGGWSIYDNQ